MRLKLLYLFHFRQKNSEEWTNTAGISKYEENEAKPADLVEGKSNVNHRQLINNEHPKKVAQEINQSSNKTMVSSLLKIHFINCMHTYYILLHALFFM